MNPDQVVYHSEMCNRIIEIMRNGALLEDVINLLQIDEKSLNDWRIRYPEFDKAVDLGLLYSECWWEDELQGNHSNPSSDFEHVRKVLVNNFGWEDL